jgi:Ti-type conjugative transfer relaxase TraA
VALATVTPVGGPRHSTVDLLAVEADLIARARRRADIGVAVVPVTALDKALGARPSLSVEQRNMVAQLTRSGAGVDVVVGRTGSGKTFALDAARSAWETAGTPVIGAALAARAAAELQAGAGIPSDTIDRLLIDAERPGPHGGLEAGSVLVVDEAGMAGTRKLARLLNVAQRSNAKVVLVGDPRQLPEIEAGGAFVALTRQLPAVELVDNRRQTNSWERAALAELRSGSVPAAVVAYAQAGRITVTPTADAARETMVGDWWASRRAGHDAAMYALRCSDVQDLNARARERMRTEGLLGTDTVEVGGREFAAGDDIIFLRNDRRLGVKNGGTATVTAVDPKTATITVNHGSGEPVTVIPTEYLEAGHVAYGYATTIHKSQGATVDRAFLLGSDTLYREAGYSGLSRSRDCTNLYLVAPPVSNDLGRDDIADPVMELAARLGVSRAQLLATDQLPPDTTPPAPRPIKELAVEARRLAATLTADRQPRAEQDGPGWLNEHRGNLDRWRQLQAAITQQRHALTAAAIADPPAHLIEALGRPAAAGPDRHEWGQAARRVEAYRATHDITDTHDVLGPRPEQLADLVEWRHTRAAIENYQHRNLDHGLSL